MDKLAIGIDIGGTNTRAGLVNLEKGTTLQTLFAPTEKGDAGRFLDSLMEMIKRLKDAPAGEGRKLAGIGIGVSSFVTPGGIVDSTYGFQEFMEDYPLVSLVEERSGLTCRVDNDARVVALGEALYGAGKGFERVLVLTLGTGLGVGFVAGGKFDSPLPYGHMAGHLSVGDPAVTCYCGKKGCLEALVSATGITDAAGKLKWVEKYPDRPLEASEIFRGASEGIPEAVRVVDQVTRDLRRGIDNYINLMAPEVIILGGGVAKGLEPYLHRLKPMDTLKPFKKYEVSIRLSILADQAGILGSAALLNR